MITSASDQKGRIVRVLTYGKEPGAVDQAILDAVEGGHRVLVKVFSASEAPPASSAGASAVADWAGTLARTYGLAWERVGGDVLFHRSVSGAARDTP